MDLFCYALLYSVLGCREGFPLGRLTYPHAQSTDKLHPYHTLSCNYSQQSACIEPSTPKERGVALKWLLDRLRPDQGREGGGGNDGRKCTTFHTKRKYLVTLFTMYCQLPTNLAVKSNTASRSSDSLDVMRPGLNAHRLISAFVLRLFCFSLSTGSRRGERQLVSKR
ncbi:hypothetical protein LZ30DRAFT_349533 [Colletotrichum cereale]|nr:hypothetical protein LZ30DRAFT_349533 [Colletotrichum cereale]